MITQSHIHPTNRPHLSAIPALLLALAFAALPSTTLAQDTVRVAWNANPESDIAGYKVYLGTESGHYSQIQNVGNQATAVLSSPSPSTTYYCAVQAYNTAALESELSAEISFTTQATPGNFNVWASAAGLSGAAAAPDAMPFNDGVSNLLKFAFNLNATRPDMRVLTQGTGTAGLPVFTLNRNGSQAEFTVEFLRRTDGGLLYAPVVSPDLTAYEPMTGTSTVTPINASWERVILRMPCNLTITPKLFGMVEVTMP